MPGNFIVKASQHPFLAGEYKAAEIPALPVGLTPKVLELKYAYKDLKPVVDAPYLVLFDNGTQNAGTLDANGEAKIPNPPGPGKVFFGYDQRDAFPYPERPANPILGFKPTSPEDAAQALERYAKAEADFMEDNYFPDEVAAIYSGGEDYDDLLSDYEYDSESVIEELDDATPGKHDEVMLDDHGTEGVA
ncbi:hypothetical protein [[Pseudomonas] boreopolis]|uniref:Uncharacterized protein n=1 Tax=Xanthomonas boreopolis TaxID=86183 RepID=A0A919FCM1_9XANT|nr:hypothetical protein GCM10009090_35950 [[Pseudomonas] boreopolis]